MASSCDPTRSGSDSGTGTGTDTCTPRAVPPLPMPKDEAARDAQLAVYAKALGHPARVAILRLLIRQEACICGEIVDQLPLAQSTVSQHLKVLKTANLIQGTIDGPRICYCINPAALTLFHALLGELWTE
jgi:ArsR family transcriptional regulator, arsenate/arsenite/antimonite-responsive transcriptional repressor